MSKIDLVRNAMLAVQRYPWEQGVCMQALYELGDVTTAVAMAHDAVLRQQEDGRLAVTGNNIAVTDPAANGEVVFRAWELTKDPFYRDAASKMLDYLLKAAPRTDKNIICHNEVTFWPEFSPNQIWVDSIYMAPPFLAVMGHLDEAYSQILGMINYLKEDNDTTGLLYHIYDAGQNRFVRQKHWASGNGWALLGMARVIDEAEKQKNSLIKDKLVQISSEILDSMIKFQTEDGLFHDILDDEDSFVEGTGAMMASAFIYRGCFNGWLSKKYLSSADKVSEVMDNFIDEFGIIHQVCGCPDFVKPGTSAEAQAAYLMMHAWKNKLSDS